MSKRARKVNKFNTDWLRESWLVRLVEFSSERTLMGIGWVAVIRSCKLTRITGRKQKTNEKLTALLKMGQVKLWPDRAGLVGKLVKLSSIVIFSHTGNMWQGCVCLKNSATFHEWDIREPLLLARKGGFPCPLMRELSSCSSENWRSSENEIIFRIHLQNAQSSSENEGK